MPELIQPFLEYGLVGILIFLIGWGLLLIGKWVAPKVDLLIDTHVEMVKNTDARLGNVEDKITNLSEIQFRQTDILEKMQDNHLIMMSNQKTMIGNQTSIVAILERYKTNGTHPAS